MRRAWIFAWAWCLGAVLALVAPASALESAENGYMVSRLPACILARQGREIRVNDADPDCSHGSGIAGSAYAICICDPVRGWQTVTPGGGGGGGGSPTGSAGGDLAGSYPSPTIAPNAVALGTDTTGGYAGSSTEAGAATSALAVTGFTASKCARFDASGVLVAASGDCTSGDTVNAGTVTSVAVATANGVSATVANSTSTPSLTFTLGALTPSSLAASGSVTGSNLSGINTGDQTDITGNAGTANALFANPADCSSNQFATTIAANGDLTCSQVAYSQISGTPAAGIGGTLGGADNAIPRSDGTGGLTAQASALSIDDSGRLIFGTDAMIRCGASTDQTYHAPSGCEIRNAAGTSALSMGVQQLMIGTPASNGGAVGAIFRQGDAWFGGTYSLGWSDTPGNASSRVTFFGPVSGSGRMAIGTTNGGVDGRLDLGVTRKTPRASPPVTCGDADTEGIIYYDTSHALCICGASAWINLTPGDLGSCS